MREFTVLLLSLLAAAKAFYSSSDDVIQLTDANFNQEVLNSDDLWLVEFYAPWCGSSRAFAPEWKQAATSLKGMVKVAAVDVDANNGVGFQYEIKGYPTVKIFGLNKRFPPEYLGSRDASSIVNAALETRGSMIRKRQSGETKVDTSSDVVKMNRRFQFKKMVSF